MSNEQLALRIQAGDNVAENMLSLWNQCRGFIATLAQSYQARAEKDDLMQEGYLALCEAVEGYEQDRGMSFIGYAAFYIKNRMRSYCQASGAVRVPMGAGARLRKYNRLRAEFRKEYGRAPSDREICALMEINKETLRRIQKTASLASVDSLERPLDESEEVTVGDTVPDPEDVEGAVLDAVQEEELQAVLWSLVDSLGEERAAVIRGRYQDGLTRAELGKRLDLKEWQLVNHEEKAMRELRRPSRKKVLRPFMDEYISTHAFKGNGVQAFNRSWTSSTERVALRMAEGRF